jgi:hypothetical protein
MRYARIVSPSEEEKARRKLDETADLAVNQNSRTINKAFILAPDRQLGPVAADSPQRLGPLGLTIRRLRGLV